MKCDEGWFGVVGYCWTFCQVVRVVLGVVGYCWTFCQVVRYCWTFCQVVRVVFRVLRKVRDCSVANY